MLVLVPSVGVGVTGAPRSRLDSRGDETEIRRRETDDRAPYGGTTGSSRSWVRVDSYGPPTVPNPENEMEETPVTGNR